jgi:hypothetical protein
MASSQSNSGRNPLHRFQLYSFGVLIVVIGRMLTADADAHEFQLPVTDGTINTILIDGETTYIGGQFSQVGAYIGSCVVFDSVTGLRDGRFPLVNGPIYAAIADGTGGFYIGGQFTKVGNVRRNRVAHLLSDGSVDPAFDVNVELSYVYKFSNAFGTSEFNGEGRVTCLLLDGDVLYLGGTFKRINGNIERWGLAAVNRSTGQALPFNPDVGFGPWGGGAGVHENPGNVLSLAVHGDSLYIGGDFGYLQSNALDAATALPRRNIAEVHKITGDARPWNPNGTMIHPDMLNHLLIPRAIAIRGTTELIIGGGSLSRFSGQNYISNQARVAGCARIDLATGSIAPWNPEALHNSPGSLFALQLVGSSLYVGGEQSVFGTSPNLWGWNVVNGSILPWDPSVDDQFIDLTVDSKVYAMVRDGSGIWVGGQLVGTKSSGPKPAIWVDFSTGIPHVPTLEMNLPAYFTEWQEVRALALSAGKLLVGGNYSVVDVQPRGNLAAFATETGRLLDWEPSVRKNGRLESAYVRSLAKAGETVIIGGDFDSITGQEETDSTLRSYLAAVDAFSGKVTAFDPQLNLPVFSVGAIGTTVYAAGDFSLVNQPKVIRNFLASFDLATGAVLPWNPDPDDLVRALLITSDPPRIFAGGFFTSVNGGLTERGGLAAWDSNGNLLPFAPRVAVSSAQNKAVLSLGADSGTVFAGGSFSSVLDSSGIVQERTYAAAFNSTTGALTEWQPEPAGQVNTVATGPASIFLGGNFNQIGRAGGPKVPNFVEVDKDLGAVTSLALPDVFEIFRASGVESLAVTDGRVFAGGRLGGFSAQPEDFDLSTPYNWMAPGFYVGMLPPEAATEFVIESVSVSILAENQINAVLGVRTETMFSYTIEISNDFVSWSGGQPTPGLGGLQALQFEGTQSPNRQLFFRVTRTGR